MARQKKGDCRRKWLTKGPGSNKGEVISVGLTPTTCMHIHTSAFPYINMHICMSAYTHAHVCVHAHARCTHPDLSVSYTLTSPWLSTDTAPHKALFPDLCCTCPLYLSQLNMPPLRKANCAPPPPKWFLLRSSSPGLSV